MRRRERRAKSRREIDVGSVGYGGDVCCLGAHVFNEAQYANSV